MRPDAAFDVCLDVYRTARTFLDEKLPTTNLALHASDGWRPSRARLAEFVADFALCGERALGSRRFGSRLILFRAYCLGGCDWGAACRHLGVSQATAADWLEEIRHLVGMQVLYRGLFPPRQYFQ